MEFLPPGNGVKLAEQVEERQVVNVAAPERRVDEGAVEQVEVHVAAVELLAREVQLGLLLRRGWGRGRGLSDELLVR